MVWTSNVLERYGWASTAEKVRLLKYKTVTIMVVVVVVVMVVMMMMMKIMIVMIGLVVLTSITLRSHHIFQPLKLSIAGLEMTSKKQGFGFSKQDMPCYRKEDRAMRRIYGCSEKFREFLTTPTATRPIADIFNRLLFWLMR